MTSTLGHARALLAVFALGLALSQPAAPAGAQVLGGIAAVVNEEAITASDLEGRLALGLLASGLPNTQEARATLRPQVLRTLIDERLRLQEATRLEIEPSEEAIQEGVATIARQNGLDLEGMRRLFSQRNIPMETLEDQVRAGLAWNDLISRRLSGDVEISDADIDDVIGRIEANRGLNEYLLGEIVLPVADRTTEQEVATFAREIVQRIRAGASFPAIARQFSAAAGADTGGDLGWMLEGGFSPEVEEALATLQPGEVTEPLRGITGYTILLMRRKRQVLVGDASQTTINLRRLALAFPADIQTAERQTLLADLEAFRDRVEGCQALREQSEAEDFGTIEDLGDGKINDLGEAIRDRIASLPVGQPSELLEFPNGGVFYMVCKREVPGESLPEREEIARDLRNEQLDRMQRRYLRDLRNAAYIEVRG